MQMCTHTELEKSTNQQKQQYTCMLEFDTISNTLPIH